MVTYIISALVGAVIGYITNYIAIKMLFRPHEEIRIFGIRVPFTPGLIPKEKTRIAKSVGDTIGTHLLTSETIIGALEGDTIKAHMKGVVKSKVEKIASEEKSLGDFLGQVADKSFQGFKLKVELKICEIIIKKIKTAEVIEKFSSIIFEKILTFLKRKPDIIVNLIESEEFKEKIVSIIEKYKGDQDIQNKISTGILNEIEVLGQSDMLIEQLIPNEVFGALEIYVYNERENISTEIKEILRKAEVSSKIKNAISENILREMSPLVSMFLSVDSLYDKFLAAADGYLSEEENKVNIAKGLSEYIHKLSQKEVKNVINNIPQNAKVVISEVVRDLLKNKLFSSDVVENQLSIFIEKVKNIESYDQLISKLYSGYYKDLEKSVKDTLMTLVNTADMEEFIKNSVSNGLNELLNMPTNTLVTDKNNIIEIIYTMVEKSYDKFVENEAANVVSLLNIPKIVENQINSFEVDEAEKIILDIANKELNAITWLGALLGAILGILSPLISSLYM
jgi:uncharacterized membrane protein YheB (UPF0754 family)